MTQDLGATLHGGELVEIGIDHGRGEFLRLPVSQREMADTSDPVGLHQGRSSALVFLRPFAFRIVGVVRLHGGCGFQGRFR